VRLDATKCSATFLRVGEDVAEVLQFTFLCFKTMPCSSKGSAVILYLVKFSRGPLLPPFDISNPGQKKLNRASWIFEDSFVKHREYQQRRIVRLTAIHNTLSYS
jgi:hypothetical protein